MILTLLACSAYPTDANLKIEANALGYSVYGESQGYSSELGMLNNPEWLYGLQQEVKVQVIHEERYRVLYDGPFLDETGKRAAPYLEKILDQAGAIGADCGFHHPDSHNPCSASVKVDQPVTLVYRINSFPGEKNTSDNEVEYTFSLEDMEGHARTLSYQWWEQERKEAEAEQREIAEKSKGWK